MASEGDSYFTNLLYGGSTTIDEFSSGIHSQADQYIPSPSQAQTESTTKKKNRSHNFTNEEDILLISAWLNISMDAVQGNEQKGNSFWKRICEFFHSYKKFDSERTANSLMNRWSTIQQAVNKFCGCYAQIEARQQSGLTETDKIFQAKALFHNTLGHPFQFLHCWNELKHHPKWIMEGSKKKSKTNQKGSPATSTPPTPDSVNLGDDIVADHTFVDLERPLGRKAEKERLKKGKGKDNTTTRSSTVLLEQYIDRKKLIDEEKIELLRSSEAREQEMFIIMKEKHQRKEQQEDERIMSIDTTGMPPMKSKYYESLQLEIMRKRFDSNQ